MQRIGVEMREIKIRIRGIRGIRGIRKEMREIEVGMQGLE